MISETCSRIRVIFTPSKIMDSVFGDHQMRIDFKDPVFPLMNETLKGLAHIFISFTNVWVELAVKNSRDGLRMNMMSETLNAGKLINMLIIQESEQVGKTTLIGDTVDQASRELTDEYFNKIVEAFHTYILSNSNLKHIAMSKTVMDPVDLMWKFCRYFIISVRITPSVPRAVKVSVLKKWLTVCFMIPYVSQYTNKLVSTMPNITSQQGFCGDLTASKVAMDKLSKINSTITDKCIGRTYATDDATVWFIRNCMQVMLVACTESIKWCNPCAAIGHSLNNKYFGDWYFPDEFVDKQILAVRELSQFVITGKPPVRG